MMDMDRVPQARHWAIPLMLAGACNVWVRSRPATTAMSILLMVSVVFLLWAIGNFVIWIVSIIGEERRKNRELDFKFTNNYLAETVAHMNDHQLKAIRIGRHIVEIIPGQNHPVEKLYGTEVYLYTAWYILVNSTDYNVHPINRFQQGTYHFDLLGDQSVDDYQQAKNFHQWLKWMDYAEWGRGNLSMSWKSGFGPDKLLEMLGLDRESYEL